MAQDIALGIDALQAAADEILASIPDGLLAGRISAGLYGYGFLGQWALPRLKKTGIKLVSCHDSNAALVGTIKEGIPVCDASELERSCPEFLFITARHAVGPISRKLSHLGIRHVSYDAWCVASEFAAFRRIHDQFLSDDRSKTVLRFVLMAMLTGDKSYCEAVFEQGQYFCLPRFCGSEKETFVDAGAYVGDAVERFVWRHNGAFSKIYAFEPGPRQFPALKRRTDRLIAEWALDATSIELINAGLGDREGSSAATACSGQMTSLSAVSDAGPQSVGIAITSLDAYLKGAPITFLKADVEGMEMAFLRGAQSTIRGFMPKIAICVYHYPTDIPEILNHLRELVPTYRFALRHHSPQQMETVLYCWVDQRAG